MSAAAQAAPITGTVRDAAGAPVAAAEVVAYDLTLGAVRSTTDDAGRFSIAVEGGRWRVRAIPPDGHPAAEGWFPGASTLCAATLVDPSDEASWALPVGFALTGQVVDPAGRGVAGLTVSAEPIDTTELEVRHAITDADGRFAVTGLTATPTGWQHRLALSGDGWPEQYLGAPYDVDAATAFDMQVDQEVGVWLAAVGISVSGAVTAGGAPLTDGVVQVYVPSQLESAWVTDGTYAVSGLPAGDVLVWAYADGFGTSYWPDVAEPGERVSVADGAAAVLDLTLPVESVLAGRLPGDGPFDGASVVLYNPSRSVGVGAVVASDGTFRVTRLQGGTFSLGVYAAGAGLVEGTLRAADGEDAWFDVPAVAAVDVGTLDVPSAGVLAGTVHDRYTGAPVPGAYVYAERSPDGELAVARSDGAGAWVLDGLLPGDYALWVDQRPACDGDPAWLSRWYPDNPDDTFAGTLTVWAGETAHWDAELPPDVDGDGMDDVWEAGHGLDPTRNDAAEDLDGDGFTNLEEYQLGTDPSQVAAPTGCGCAHGPTGLSSAVGCALVALSRRFGARRASRSG